MRIAVFDYLVKRTNPIGGCHLRLLNGLADEHDFVVFAVEFQNPRPDRIRFVRVPAPTRPLALLFVSFHILAPLFYLWHRVRTGAQFDLVQMVESKLLFGDLSYTHFCHRSFLKHHWRETASAGIRGILRSLDHRLHALCEPLVFRRVGRVVVPSRGLARELSREFPVTTGKTQVVSNAVEVSRLLERGHFERDRFRAALAINPDDTVFLFMALGQFERKGLPILLEALQRLRDPRARLIVVGGEQDLITSYRERVRVLELGPQVHFAGMQQDVRPYFWASDAFAFPSLYETFSLVAYEAAAAGLPLLVPRLNGVEELIKDGENGLLLDPTIESVESVLRRFQQLSPVMRKAMGEQAQKAAAQYNEQNFLAAWRSIYQQWTSGEN